MLAALQLDLITINKSNHGLHTRVLLYTPLRTKKNKVVLEKAWVKHWEYKS